MHVCARTVVAWPAPPHAPPWAPAVGWDPARRHTGALVRDASLAAADAWCRRRRHRRRGPRGRPTRRRGPSRPSRGAGGSAVPRRDQGHDCSRMTTFLDCADPDMVPCRPVRTGLLAPCRGMEELIGRRVAGLWPAVSQRRVGELVSHPGGFLGACLRLPTRAGAPTRVAPTLRVTGRGTCCRRLRVLVRASSLSWAIRDAQVAGMPASCLGHAQDDRRDRTPHPARRLVRPHR